MTLSGVPDEQLLAELRGQIEKLRVKAEFQLIGEPESYEDRGESYE